MLVKSCNFIKYSFILPMLFANCLSRFVRLNFYKKISEVISEMNKPLIPRKVINVQGKLHYNEGNQAWNKLKFKKELLDEFPQLKQKRSKFSYEMKYFRDSSEFEKLMKEVKKKPEALPVLIWFYEES